MAAQIVVLGSSSVDFFCYAERLPKPGETLHGYKFVNGFGGKGANQCIAAAKLGAKVAMIGLVGDDNWADDYLKNFIDHQVKVDHVLKYEGKSTGIAQIGVADNGENHIIIVAGANNCLSEEHVDKAEKTLNEAKILVCQMETPIKTTIYALKKFKGLSILNAAPALSNTPQELVSLPTILCVNESEAALMTGVDAINTLQQAKEALITLQRMGANTVIITLGPSGAVYVEKKDPTNYVHVPVKKVDRVVDTTGAGDAFIGALAYYLAEYPQLPLHQQIGASNEIAAYSVQFEGTQTSFPTCQELKIKLNSNSYNFKLL